jgi:hypothetical protein
MRVNVYTEELLKGGGIAPNRLATIVTAEYVSSRTGEPMKNYGLRIFLASPPELHDSPRDDDRSAVTFWCGSDVKAVFAWWDMIKYCLEQVNLDQWREKVKSAAEASEIAEKARRQDPFREPPDFEHE